MPGARPQNPGAGSRHRPALWLCCVLLWPGAAGAQAAYSPGVGQDYPRGLYWGDTHLHTNRSPDAGNMGNVRMGPDDAYRFARGETVRAHNGMDVRMGRPLDFLVVADHAEHLGVLPGLAARDPLLLKSPTGKRWAELLHSGKRAQLGREIFAATVAGRNLPQLEEFTRSVWKKGLESAERYNEPGVFTALLGYEWTSSRDGSNLHRVVIFRDGPDRVGRVMPFSSLDSAHPEDLWKFMADYAQNSGGDVLAIPHNSNLSAGRMFALEGRDGKALRAPEAALRQLWEPLAEVTQYKGDSEAHPFLSPQDAFADYGTWDRQSGIDPSRPHEDWMYAGEYLRQALKRGLLLKSRLGLNPFRFGMIGGTDSHTSLATAEEDNFWGKYVVGEAAPGRALRPMMASLAGGSQAALGNWVLLSSGYTAVWAHENTRASLFDALRRREAYATTGPRIVLRFFGGWNFRPQDAHRPDLARAGYAGGVPMGGVLPAAPGRSAVPGFLLLAARDPLGANLDRVQIVKGWLDRRGQLREKVYDAAVSGKRRIGRDGRARRDVGNTVDLKTASYLNTIGAPLLSAVWKDPDFDPRAEAFYYVRVIEIPTPRWTAYDEARFGDRLPAEIPRITRERAYSSPIWYSPPH